ncbi:hypothetical protein RCC89_12405 [Cytophagaceae bacterium ABcell3]|nr:hypothetical protein RCC89_12405 [Cytophagaceae bacterium ABcell3]
MTDLERNLFEEMVRTIHLLGGKDDIIGALGTLNTQMPQGEATEETYRLVKCWNDNVESKLEKIPENKIYKSNGEYIC